MHDSTLTHLSDAALLRELTALVAHDRVTTAKLLAHLAEVDARRLYVPAGYSSMFAYCVDVLRLSEDAAYKRIQAARAARRYPILFTAVADGRLHLTAAGLLAPHLTAENAQELIEAATHRRKSEIEEWLAQRFVPRGVMARVRPVSTIRPIPAQLPAQGGNPQPDLLAPGQAGFGSNSDLLAPGQVGCGSNSDLLAPGQAGFGSNSDLLAPGQVGGGSHSDGVAPDQVGGASNGDLLAPAQVGPSNGDLLAPAQVGPSNGDLLAPAQVEVAPPTQRYLVQLTIDRSIHEKLRYAQALLSHAVPTGDLSKVLDHLLDVAIPQLEKRKLGAGAGPRRPSADGHHPAQGGSACPTRNHPQGAAAHDQPTSNRSTDGVPTHYRPAHDRPTQDGATHEHPTQDQPTHTTRSYPTRSHDTPTHRRRHIPSSVRRAVWERDQGQCTFVSAAGHRCSARSFLEFDHVEPVARGGRATVAGMRLRCRAHNQYEAELTFGIGFMARKRREARLTRAGSRAKMLERPQTAEWAQMADWAQIVERSQTGMTSKDAERS